MSRSNALAVVSFVVVFAAGFFVGRLRWAAPAPADGAGSWLAAQLDLTDDQREQVKRIWAEQLRSDPADKLHAAERKRDEALTGLISDPQQRAAYQTIAAGHAEDVRRIRAEYAQSVARAEEATKAVLAPAQREKFVQIVQQHAHRFGRPPAAASPQPTPDPPGTPRSRDFNCPALNPDRSAHRIWFHGGNCVPNVAAEVATRRRDAKVPRWTLLRVPSRSAPI